MGTPAQSAPGTSLARSPNALSVSGTRTQSQVLTSLPRRQVSASPPAEAAMPPMAKLISLQTTTVGAWLAFARWVFLLVSLLLAAALDTLTFRASVERRALRLKRRLERGGPGMIRIGQYLTIRSDLLPPEYCDALSELEDIAKPFRAEQAVRAVERAAKADVRAVFAVFDPQPIASTSVACVYQALLPSGGRVGVKVRRPNVEATLGAHLKAFGWLANIAEGLGLLRQRGARNLRDELRAVFSEALNFTLEARYNEIFASKARKKHQDHIQAPTVHFDLSNDEVLVTEFVAGVFLWEVIEAVEQGDPAELAELSSRGIDPVLIAKRLTRSLYWEALENIFFHADPSPGKIVVREDNTLVFIDFASCGRFSERIKRYYQQLQHYMEREDVGGMVDATLSMLEPLPPIDLERFTKAIEGVYWDWLYATKSKHADWWERTTGELWTQIVDVARRSRVSVQLDVLRLFRAATIYDAAAMRLWQGLDLSKEYTKYAKERGRRARRRVRRTLRRRLERGPSAADYLALQDLSRLLTQVVNRGQHILDRPAHRFAGMISKAAYVVSMILRVLLIATALHGMLILGYVLVTRWLGRPTEVPEAIELLLYHPAYQALIAFSLLILVRRALMRLEDIDVDQR